MATFTYVSHSRADHPPKEALDRVWRLVAQSIAGEFVLDAEISRSADERHVAYLAHSPNAVRQTAALPTYVIVQASGTEAYAVNAQSSLERTVPAEDLICPHCRQPAATWDTRCHSCTGRIGSDRLADLHLSAETLDAGVANCVRPMFQVLGRVPHGVDSTLFLARRHESGELTLLRAHLRTASPTAAGAVLAVESVASVRRRPESPHSGEIGPLANRDADFLSNEPRARKVCPQCEVLYDGDMKFCPTDGQGLRPLDPREDLIGHLLGDRYHVTALLGEGGMGRVYLAEHVRIGRRCAVKVLSPELADRPDAMLRFAREARSASRIAHPNVAAVYDFEQLANGLTYLAMEFCEGEPLAAMLEREGRLAITRAIAIARQIADGIQVAHDLGIVHRDLKPENVMIGRDRGGGDLVKVVDFGIAKDAAAPGDRVTRTGFVIGTPRYMSPEQLSGQAVDARSDVYSLGCVLFEMLTGVCPGDDVNREALIRRRLDDAPPRPSAIRPEIPRELDDLVVKALARDPADRLPTAISLRDALSTVPAVLTRKRRFATTAAAIVLIIGVAASLVLSGRGRARSAQAVPPPTTTNAPMEAAPSARATPPTSPAPHRRVRARDVPGDPPGEAIDAVQRDIRLGKYYASEEPPEYDQAMRSFRSASTALAVLEQGFPHATSLGPLRQSLNIARAQAHRDCVALLETRPASICD